MEINKIITRAALSGGFFIGEKKMADTTIVYPYEFQGGRKAVASEVNANFEAVKTFANGINVSLSEIRSAINELKNKPTREMLDIYYSFSSVAPTGAYPLWTGETINHCKSLYPQFWNKVKNLAQMGNLTLISLEEYEERLENYGQCAAFYIDELNGHLRLPKITRFISSISELSERSKEEKAGLPNIKGSGYWNMLNDIKAEDDSAVYGDSSGVRHLRQTNGNEHYGTARMMFDASRSNEIFGASDTVQPPAVKLCLYIQVANNLGELSELDTQAIAKELEEDLSKLQVAYNKYAADLKLLYGEIKEDILNAAAAMKEKDIKISSAMFAEDTTYEEYPYCLSIPFADSSSDKVPSVNFDVKEAESGNFAPVAIAETGIVKIFAKKVVEENFLIPSIVLQ